MNSNKTTIKVLITDYDKCALAPKPNGRDDLLSDKLIEIAKKNEYAGFYGCTHRCVATTLLNPKFYTDYLLYLLNYKMNPLNAFTVSVTANLISGTGLTCFGVSTPDDDSPDAPLELAEKCGFGFSQLIKSHEERIISGFVGLRSSNDTLFPAFESTFKPIHWSAFHGKDKNAQLTKIMHHARALMPDNILEFHYMDDVLDLCESVKNITVAEMPTDVILKSYQHCDSYGITANLDQPVCSITSMTMQQNIQQNLFTGNSPREKISDIIVTKDLTVASQRFI